MGINAIIDLVDKKVKGLTTFKSYNRFGVSEKADLMFLERLRVSLKKDMEVSLGISNSSNKMILKELALISEQYKIETVSMMKEFDFEVSSENLGDYQLSSIKELYQKLKNDIPTQTISPVRF